MRDDDSIVNPDRVYASVALAMNSSVRMQEEVGYTISNFLSPHTYTQYNGIIVSQVYDKRNTTKRKRQGLEYAQGVASRLMGQSKQARTGSSSSPAAITPDLLSNSSSDHAPLAPTTVELTGVAEMPKTVKKKTKKKATKPQPPPPVSDDDDNHPTGIPCVGQMMLVVCVIVMCVNVSTSPYACTLVI
jgi:hypothetical protein